jgi:hypothetical protein
MEALERIGPYAANACPAGSVYGHVKVLTPLLDYPLESNIYLRFSSHQLPDVVAGQNGKTYDTQPAIKADYPKKKPKGKKGR